jgi:DNA-binding NarL/FixJ family response regulator
VLLVEDDHLVATSLRRGLQRAGFRVQTAATLDDARDILDHDTFTAAVVDLGLPDGDGAQLLPMLAECIPAPIVIVMSGMLTSERAVDVAGLCDATVPKPCSPRLIAQAIANAARPASNAVAAYARAHGVSDKEAEVLMLAASGASTRDNAERLSVKPSSIHTYWRRIFWKTGIRSQSQVLAQVFMRAMQRRRGS